MPGNDDYDFSYKICIAGKTGVGKSNILSRFCRDDFNLETKSTIGMEFATKTVECTDNNNKPVKVKLQLWDLPGERKHRAIANSHYRGAVGVVIVYDISKVATFTELEAAIAEQKEYNPGASVYYLVGNKSDLRHLREISTEAGKEFAAKNNMCFIETSALDNSNVERLFSNMAQNILDTSLRPAIVETVVQKETPFTNKLKVFSEKINQLKQPDKKVNSEVTRRFEALHNTIESVSKMPDTDLNNRSHTIVLDHFINEADKVLHKPNSTLVEVQKSANQLDQKLNGKPPMHPLVKVAACALVGALVGAAIGLVVGTVATIPAGGFGGIPGAIVGAFKGFTLVTAAMTGGAISSSIVAAGIAGLFCNKSKRKAEETLPLNTGKAALHSDVEKAIDNFYGSSWRR